MQLINLTPHAIHIGSLTIEPSGTIARAREVSVDLETITVDGHEVPIRLVSYGDLTGLPEPRPGVAYIVSSLAAQAAVGRTDVFVPTDPIRDGEGRIVGCRALARTGGRR